jgi:uncharacterized damage-inducible protein DinB
MDANTIQTLFEYDRWANARILDAAATLSKEQFLRDLRSSHGSVRDTLMHIISGEWIRLMRWQGNVAQGNVKLRGIPDNTAS